MNADLFRFTPFNKANTADPSLEEVTAFQKDSFPDTFSIAAGGFPPKNYFEARDQIIQGWVVKGWEPPKLDERRKYKDFPEEFFAYRNRDNRAGLFLKGHNLQKVIYCAWHEDVVFYCQSFFDQSTKAFDTILKEPESYLALRFYKDASFYYSDDLTHSWKTLPFSEFSRLADSQYAATTSSTGHRGQSLTTINIFF